MSAIGKPGHRLSFRCLCHQILVVAIIGFVSACSIGQDPDHSVEAAFTDLNADEAAALSVFFSSQINDWFPAGSS